MTHRNLVVTWKVDPNEHYFLISPELALVLSRGGCVLVPSLRLILQFVPPKRKETVGICMVGFGVRITYQKIE